MLEETSLGQLRQFSGWSISDWSLFPRVHLRLHLVNFEGGLPIGEPRLRAFMIFLRPEAVTIQYSSPQSKIREIRASADRSNQISVLSDDSATPIFDVWAKAVNVAFVL